jgi:hypothetical protein
VDALHETIIDRSAETDASQSRVDIASLLITFDDDVMLSILSPLDRRSLVRYSCCVAHAIRIRDTLHETLWEEIFQKEFKHVRHDRALAALAPSFKTRCRLAPSHISSDSKLPKSKSYVEQINEMVEFRVGSAGGVLDSSLQLTHCNSRPVKVYARGYGQQFRPMKSEAAHIAFEAAFPETARLDSAHLFVASPPGSILKTMSSAAISIYARRRADGKVARVLDMEMMPNLERYGAYETHNYHHSWQCHPEPPWQPCSYPQLVGDATCETDDDEHGVEFPRWSRLRFNMRFGPLPEEDLYSMVDSDEEEYGQQQNRAEEDGPAICEWGRHGPTAFLGVLKRLEWV